MATSIPKNSAQFTLAEVLSITSGTLVSKGSVELGSAFGEVSTDTRALDPGGLFVALRGETFDGHDHVGAAARAGATGLLVERDVSLGDVGGAAVVRVANTLVALGALGRAHARRWRALGGVRKTVAITGSAGKTTTRVALQALLSASRPGEVHATKCNLNNLVGTPMVLFGLTAAHRFAVVEIGTNRPGEIEALTRMVEPDVGVVTLVAAAHTEELGSVEGVAHEKGALFRGLTEHGVAVGNGENEHVRAQIQGSPATKKIVYGTQPGADVRIVARTPSGMLESRVRFELKGRSIEVVTPLLGEAGALACAAALAVAEVALGEVVTEALANKAFANAEVGGGAGRLVPIMLGQNVAAMDDTYNANPASMRASIRAAKEIAASEGRRLVLVLGEMRELGAVAESGHDEVGHAAKESGAAVVIAVGEMAIRYANVVAGGASVCAHVLTAEHASSVVKELVLSGDLILVKGSRGIGTDAVVRALREHLEPKAATHGEVRAHA